MTEIEMRKDIESITLKSFPWPDDAVLVSIPKADMFLERSRTWRSLMSCKSVGSGSRCEPWFSYRCR